MSVDLDRIKRDLRDAESEYWGSTAREYVRVLIAEVERLRSQLSEADVHVRAIEQELADARGER